MPQSEGTDELEERRSSSDEDALAAEQRFHHLVDAVTDYAIFMLDRSGRITTWNPGAESLKGYGSSEIIGRHLATFYTEDDRRAGRPERLLAIALNEGRVKDEGWRVRKDGTRFWADVVITRIQDADGNIVGFAKVTRDLTQRREAEEALRRSEERFRLLVEGVSDYAIYMLDPSGIVTTWNLGASRMKGYSAAEIIGQSFERFFPDEDRASGKPASELAVAQAQGRFEDEGWRIRKDGTRFWANVIVSPIRGPDDELLGFAKITRDLTARREAAETEKNLLREQARRAAAEEVAQRAEEANRVKDEFLATVSHELRTPLNAIVGWVSLLRRRELPPDIAKAIQVIDRNALAQAKIVDDILDVSRIVTGKLKIEPAPCDLIAITKQAIDVVRPSAAAKQIAITLETSFDEAPLVGDSERLQQVAWNLLSNAVKFTEPEGAIHVAVERARDAVMLQITDTGRGIDPAFLPHVFERFRQGDSSLTRRVGGLGLGLALVRHIVELHGGTVDAESAGLGEGSTFRVHLPLLRPAAAPSTDPQSAAKTPRPSHGPAKAELGRVKVVLVEDEEDTRDLLVHVLEEAGAEVSPASSVGQALGLVRELCPDVIVSDIGMPDEDGYSLVRQLRAQAEHCGTDIPAIALTAYTRKEDRDKALAAGFTSHLGKPIDPGELIAAIRSVVLRVAK